MMFRMSTHASQERTERMIYIVMNIGLGDKIVCTIERDNNKKEVLTNNGILLVLGDDNLVVTAYVPTFDQAFAIWHRCNPTIQRMPEALYQRIKNNQKHYQETVRINNEFGYHKTNKGEYKFFRKSY